jgi:hypothetical protein
MSRAKSCLGIPPDETIGFCINCRESLRYLRVFAGLYRVILQGFLSRRVLMRVNQRCGNKKISFGSAKAN